MDFRIVLLFAIFLAIFATNANGQRSRINDATRRRTHQDINREESLPKKPTPKPKKKNIGVFPYNGGEMPIFNFDQGDEAYLKTIPDLIESLHDMSRYVQAQSKVTSMYSKVFLNCPDCKP